MTKPKDEAVDGPKIAAEILKKMPSNDQKRLVKAIRDEAPAIAVQIEANLYHFDDIADLTPKSVQLLINNIQHSDLVLSFKTASETVKSAFLSNMSERKKAQVQDDFSALPPVKISEAEAAQRRILEKMEELRKSGLIHSADKKDVWA